MSIDEPAVVGTPKAGSAAALRRLFDEAFAAPAVSKPERLEDLLAIRVGSDPYALRLSEIAGLHADLRIVPIPSPAAQLLGIVGIRGAMAPIYDLAALLGYPPASGPRWIAFARTPQSVGFAFESFEFHLQVAETSLTPAGAEGPQIATRLHVRGTVRAAGAIRPIIHMASVVAMIEG